MEKDVREVLMPSGIPEIELLEIKKLLSGEDEVISRTDGCGGLFTIICCG